MIKLLGSGSYGCVINKAIKNKPYNCNYVADVTKKQFKEDEKKNKHISKIFAETESYCDELVIITKILYKYHYMFNSIDLFKELSTIPKKCSSYLIAKNLNIYGDYEKKNIIINKLKTFFKEHKKTHDYSEESITECLVEKIPYDINELKIHEIIYEYGGLSLEHVVMNDYDFIKALIIFCKSLETLHQLKFVHRDIKQQNILYNNETNKLSLIDFGLCITADDLYTDKEQWWHDGSYFVSAPEYCITEKNNKYKNLDIIYETFYKNEEFYNKKKKEYDEFFSKYSHITDIKDIPDEIKSISYKGDIYSLGITLLICYNDNNIKITHPNKELIETKLFNLIENMLITNPIDRYDLYHVMKDLFELQAYYTSTVESQKFSELTCDDDIINITTTLSLLKKKGGGKIKIKKRKKSKKNKSFIKKIT